MIQCNNCGKSNQDSAKFCTGCGLTLLKTHVPNDNILPTKLSNSTSKRYRALIAIILVLCFSGVMYFTKFSNAKKDGTASSAKDTVAVINPEKGKDSLGENGVTNKTELHPLTQSIYTGEIGNKEFTLKIESVSGNKLYGYNITGNNKRPVEGHFTEMSGNFDQFNDGSVLVNTKIYQLLLKEPGTDKWDGEFSLSIELCNSFNKGSGSWFSYNGKLRRNVVFRDKKWTTN